MLMRKSREKTKPGEACNEKLQVLINDFKISLMATILIAMQNYVSQSVSS